MDANERNNSAETEGVRKCRVCGCTDDRACAGGCSWISEDLDVCSACLDGRSGPDKQAAADKLFKSWLASEQRKSFHHQDTKGTKDGKERNQARVTARDPRFFVLLLPRCLLSVLGALGVLVVKEVSKRAGP